MDILIMIIIQLLILCFVVWTEYREAHKVVIWEPEKPSGPYCTLPGRG